MIPRTKVNFSFADLAGAALISEASDRYKVLLQRQLQDYLGVESVLLTPSGRCGLYSILKALDRPRVIVPAYTCNAVTEAALLAGKQVVYAEVEEDGFNMDPEALRDLVGPDAVVIATHQFGIPCDIERIQGLSHPKGALVVEDAAASLGTRIRGRLTGTFGDAAFFSFDISKLINVPLKGGVVLAKDRETFQRIRAAYEREIGRMPAAVKLRLLLIGAAILMIQHPPLYRLFYEWNFGRRGTFTAESPGLDLTRTMYYTYDMTNWQAYIACQQMEQIDEIIRVRQAHYSQYLHRLAESTSFATPPTDVEREWACIRFPIRVHGDKIAFYRRASRGGVDFAFSFTFIAAPEEFRSAHNLADSVLDLPFYYKLSQGELDKTVEMLTAVDRAYVMEQKTC
jgi:dTDP-4-amino-4,6-dideoxygalactose transaminase